MKQTYKYILVLSLIVLSASCKKEDDNKPITCDQKVLISSSEYNTAPDDALHINSISLVDNCLKIEFGASGCSGSSWQLKLIDSEAVQKSEPPQRTLRLSLKNEELCEAYITKELSFDISELQIGGNKVILNIKDYAEQIEYNY